MLSISQRYWNMKATESARVAIGKIGFVTLAKPALFSPDPKATMNVLPTRYGASWTDAKTLSYHASSHQETVLVKAGQRCEPGNASGSRI